MTPETLHLVRDSWRDVARRAPQAGALFYDNLFAADPSLRRLFRTPIEAQSERLMQMIGVAVANLHEPEILRVVLQGLGERHAGYGVMPSHYDAVGAALLRTLEQGLGESFTPRHREAWSGVYAAMAGTMMAAAEAATADGGVA